VIELDGQSLSIEQVQAIAAGEMVGLASAAVARMDASRAVIDRMAAGDAPVYAVNTGVGLLADARTWSSCNATWCGRTRPAPGSL
jgi:histidine ammonia-lyase